jgi:antitoxin HicB
MFDYPVTLERDPETGTVLVSFPDIPFCHSAGEDEDEALLNARDALETALAVLVESREPLPAPSAPAGRPTVRPSALDCAKLGVYEAMLEQGVRKADLARRMGWHMPQVDRLLDLRHASRMDQVEAAARALGRQIEVRIASRC